MIRKLRVDPGGERINLIAENSAIAARLEEKFKVWSATLNPPRPPEKRHEQDNKFFPEHVKSRFTNSCEAVRNKILRTAINGAKKGNKVIWRWIK